MTDGEFMQIVEGNDVGGGRCGEGRGTPLSGCWRCGRSIEGGKRPLRHLGRERTGVSLRYW